MKTYKERYNDEIELTTNRPDTESWRIDRLERVVGYICSLEEIQGCDILSKIVSLDDHKGRLTVMWRQHPQDAEKAVILKAWQSRIGDGDDVEHEVENN